MIIVSMTSWPKRICNVAAVVKSLLNQEVKPDIIQINLSEDEFKNKELDLPEDFRNILSESENLEIEWVKGNDGVFKKIIPTLKKHYGEDYLLLSVDDDWIYRKDYIKLMVGFLKKYDADSFCLSNGLIVGNRVIYKSGALSPDFWEKLTPEVVATRIDDLYIEHYMRSKQKKMAHYRPQNVMEITKKYNPIYPNSYNTSTGQYSAEDIINAKNIISKIKFEK